MVSSRKRNHIAQRIARTKHHTTWLECITQFVRIKLLSHTRM